MTTYTAADAANPAIVRAALDAALVSGEPRPRVTFGSIHPISARLDSDGSWVVATWGDAGLTWCLSVSGRLNTDQAVAAIVAARTGRN